MGNYWTVPRCPPRVRAGDAGHDKSPLVSPIALVSKASSSLIPIHQNKNHTMHMSEVKPFANQVLNPPAPGHGTGEQTASLETDGLVMYDKGLVSVDGAVKDM